MANLIYSGRNLEYAIRRQVSIYKNQDNRRHGTWAGKSMRINMV